MASVAESQLTPELIELYESVLKELPDACRPHLYNLSHRHRVVFLMETPLKRNLPGRFPIVTYVEACRQILLEWMRGKGDVWPDIVSSLPAGVVGRQIASLSDLLACAYFTDCIKCESTADDIRSHRAHALPLLRQEFALLREAVLVITIGGVAWKTAQEILGPLSKVPYGYQHLRSNSHANLTQVHGVLFERGEAEQIVIPLTFPGGQTNALRNSYIEYLQEGLAVLSARLAEKPN